MGPPHIPSLLIKECYKVWASVFLYLFIFLNVILIFKFHLFIYPSIYLSIFGISLIVLWLPVYLFFFVPFPFLFSWIMYVIFVSVLFCFQAYLNKQRKAHPVKDPNTLYGKQLYRTLGEKKPKHNSGVPTANTINTTWRTRPCRVWPFLNIVLLSGAGT